MLVRCHWVQLTLSWCAPDPVQGWERGWLDPKDSIFLPFQKMDTPLAIFRHQKFSSLLPGHHTFVTNLYQPHKHISLLFQALWAHLGHGFDHVHLCKGSLTCCWSDVGCISPSQAMRICKQISDHALLMKTQVRKSILYFSLFLFIMDKHFCWISLYYWSTFLLALMFATYSSPAGLWYD